MRTFVADIIPKIQRFSQKLEDTVLLTNQHWVVLDELKSSKTVYIFRSNGELLISINGRVSKAKWEYLGQSSILIDLKEESFLFKHGFFDENILALKIDSKDEYAMLINESKYDGELNTINSVLHFLNNKYIANPVPDISAKSKKISDDYMYVAEDKFVKKGYNIRMGSYHLWTVQFGSGYIKKYYIRLSDDKYYFYYNNDICLFSNKSSCFEKLKNTKF